MSRYLDHEKNLLEKIEKAKWVLSQFQERRALELGELAMRAGLSRFENTALLVAFQKLAKEGV